MTSLKEKIQENTNNKNCQTIIFTGDINFESPIWKEFNSICEYENKIIEQFLGD